MMRTLLVCFSISFLFLACNTQVKNKEKEVADAINLFADPVFREIHQLQDDRNTQGLLKFFDHQEAKYRAYAARSFGSVRDSAAKDKLLNLLIKDSDVEVRTNAAFALGQLRNKANAKDLQMAFEQEEDLKVKKRIIEAVGKCGSKESVDWLEQQFSTMAPALHEAVATTIYYLNAKLVISPKLEKIALDILKGTDATAVQKISHYFSRVRKLEHAELETYTRVYEQHTDYIVRYNLLHAIARCGKGAEEFIIGVLKDPKQDFRILVEALKAANREGGKGYEKHVAALTTHINPNVSYQAALYLLKHNDSVDCKELAEKASDFKTKGFLYRAAMGQPSDKSSLRMVLKQAIESESNISNKRHLVNAFADDYAELEYIYDLLQKAKEPVMLNMLTSIIANYHRLPEFKANKRYAEILKACLIHNDPAVISLSAGAIKKLDVKFGEYFSDASFILKKLETLKMPDDYEPIYELTGAYNFLTGEDRQVPKRTKFRKIDWDLISKIPSGQLVDIHTSKGNFTFKLHVDKCPGTVANFVKLLQQGFYSNNMIHRVETNFLVQDGCNRGDGWSAPEYCIKSEFNPDYFIEGIIGLASWGPDTEQAQWYVTHRPTPHLDGQYTIFGQTIEGMENVYLLQQGDIMKTYTLRGLDISEL